MPIPTAGSICSRSSRAIRRALPSTGIARRAPTQWEIHADLPGPAPQHAALALLQSGGTLTRFVLLVRDSQVRDRAQC